MGILSSIVGAGLNIAGNLFNKHQTDKANETNLKIAQMNNQFNERMMEKQMAYNTDMFNRQNDWNSATEQRKRLEQAGLNPYLMMNGGNAGTAANTLGVSAPTAAPASVVASQLDTASFNDSIRNIISESSTNASNDNLRMLTKTGYDLVNYEKALKQAMTEDYRKSREVKEQQRQQLERLNILEDSNLNSLELELRQRSVEQQFKALYQKEQVTSMILQNAFDKERLPYAKIFASNEAAMQAAQIALAYSQGLLNRAQAKEAFAKVTLIGKQAKGQQQQNDMFDRTFDATVGAVNANQNYLQTMYEGYAGLGSNYYKYSKPLIDTGKIFVGTAGKIAGKLVGRGR